MHKNITIYQKSRFVSKLLDLVRMVEMTLVKTEKTGTGAISFKPCELEE